VIFLQEVSLLVGSVVDGGTLPEPIRLVLVQEMGSHKKIAGQGLRSGKYIERVLSADQISQLKISPLEETFDGDPQKFRLGVEAKRLGLAYDFDPYFSLSIARIDPLPHQLEAVYDYMLHLPIIRFLLADDAGAGKTIMAGLLLEELKIRGLVQRTLIVTPANLSFQWQRELHDKFREKFAILRGFDLKNAYGSSPWQDNDQVITSMDWLKRPDVKESLRNVDWNLIIVDEAHKMSASDIDHKSDRYLLGEELSKKAEHFVLLTATPHKGDPLNFCLFLQLLDKDVYGDVKSLEDAMQRNYAPFYLRRTKEALVSFPDPETGVVKKIFTNREVRTAGFDLDSEESKFYLDLTSYVEDQSAKAERDQSARGRALGFAMAMYQRRFASSIYAVRRSLERRKEKLKKQLETPQTFSFDERQLEEMEDLPEDEATEREERVEDASLSVDKVSVTNEIGELDRLISQAKNLEQREVESKLAKLHDTLLDQNIFRDPRTKLLIFTEHRDTLEYLAGRVEDGRWVKGKLEEWGLKVTQIHGGMKIGDRDTPGTRLFAEEHFRDPEGAQILVATEAAGEGINLQFCWMMINYDIPWNPMRLEQRMGRIHRYLQEHDCLIFNFVAINTREGQVLERLLERLREIRHELGTDKVFDVVGEIFPANELEKLMRDLYARKTTLQNVLDRVVEDVDIEKFNQITKSALEGLAKRELNLSALIAKKELAKERRLVPEVVQSFFLQAASLVGMSPIQQKDRMLRIGKIPSALLISSRSLEPRFGALAREYRWVTFDKNFLEKDPTVEWVTPGHPLFEVVRQELLNRVRTDLEKGALFYNLTSATPVVLDVFEVSIEDGRGNTLHKRLFVTETTLEGKVEIRQPTVFLDLIPASRTSNQQLPQSIQVGKNQIEAVLNEKALVQFLEESRAERIHELEIIQRHVELSLNELINKQNMMLANQLERQQLGQEVSGLLSQTETRIDDLNKRLESKRKELAQEKEIAIGGISHLGRAWVLPYPQKSTFAHMVSDPIIEKVAMDFVMRYERDHGREPEDVSSEDRGFDILSKDPRTGIARFVEVKGRNEIGDVGPTRNEHDTAERLGKDYWLYAVFNCSTNPVLAAIQDPISKLDWRPIIQIDHYTIDGNSIIRAKEEGT
jgi:SNF2 family DNA or RNA helicase